MHESQIVPHHMWHIIQLLLHLNLHDASPLRSETDAVEDLHLIAAKALHEVQYILSGWYMGVLPHFGNLILTFSKSASESVFHLRLVLSTCCRRWTLLWTLLFVLLICNRTQWAHVSFTLSDVPCANDKCWDGYIFNCWTCPFPVVLNHLTDEYVWYCNHLQDTFHINLRS